MGAFRGQGRSEAERLVKQLQMLGIVVVEEGELENLAPAVVSSKGAGWLNEALETEAYQGDPAQIHIGRVVEAIEHLLQQDFPTVSA
jgi:hypothetical protein